MEFLSDSDLARSLQEQYDAEMAANEAALNSRMDATASHNTSSMSIIDEQWEYIDPSPDIHAMFIQFNNNFFGGKLEGVEVRWSDKMTLCAGLCSYELLGGFCSIRLSLPLLKLRPRKDLVETLLHEMIHALLFVTHNNKDHDGHGPEFIKHMDRINKETGANITIYHSFHDEVNEYRRHWWKCNGPCQKQLPYFGIVRRAMNRPPSPRDPWWSQHQQTCGGTYAKIKEPEDYGKKNKKKGEAVKGPTATVPAGCVDIQTAFSGVGRSLKQEGDQPHIPSIGEKPWLKRFNPTPGQSAGKLDSKSQTSALHSLNGNDGSDKRLLKQKDQSGVPSGGDEKPWLKRFNSTPVQSAGKMKKMPTVPALGGNHHPNTGKRFVQENQVPRPVDKGGAQVNGDSDNKDLDFHQAWAELFQRDARDRRRHFPEGGKGEEGCPPQQANQTAAPSEPFSSLDNSANETSRVPMVDLTSDPCVNCPLCQKSFVQSQINSHLDECLRD